MLFVTIGEETPFDSLVRFDFPAMCSALLRDYPGLKRHAMILAMSTNCKDVIRAKVDILRGQTWVAAAVSAAVATPPIPGLSVMFDFSLTVGFVLFYKKQLGLDDESLARIAEIHHIPVYVLQHELQKILPAHFFTAVPDFVISLVKKQAVGTATEEVLRYVPYVGQSYEDVFVSVDLVLFSVSSRFSNLCDGLVFDHPISFEKSVECDGKGGLDTH